MVLKKIFPRPNKLSDNGFSIVEILIASVILPIIVIGITISYNSVKRAYTISRQLNEIYAVLSACPELDRALEFSSLSNSNNCYPNNSFLAENGGTATISYAPVLTVTDTSSLASSDPLKTIPDSKVVSISVGFPTRSGSASPPPLQLRMLITRNGIGQQ
jgi:Tfp pilus assembly protein PilV